MQLLVGVRVVGILLCLFSATMLLPVFVSLYYDDGAAAPFFYAFLLTLVTGLCAYLPLRDHNVPLNSRDGFVIVVMFWTVLGVFGALPLFLYEPLELSAAQSIFESMSGFTTTGATLLGAHHLAQAAGADPARQPLAAFYMAHIAPQIPALCAAATAGAAPLYALDAEALAG